ncbi:hypothetical protein VNO78_20809 [Psophocarpus tetragonolobus]|uniref:Uncharacterized protein n=1 Tax=Psophocarpus tetragonolobus TaxID=3891 RepID=A0AAN9SE15_PSOTE
MQYQENKREKVKPHNTRPSGGEDHKEVGPTLSIIVQTHFVSGPHSPNFNSAASFVVSFVSVHPRRSFAFDSHPPSSFSLSTTPSFPYFLILFTHSTFVPDACNSPLFNRQINPKGEIDTLFPLLFSPKIKEFFFLSSLYFPLL